jgi:hypothetical protein
LFLGLFNDVLALPRLLKKKKKTNGWIITIRNGEKIPEETAGTNFICMKWTTKTHDEPQSGNQFPGEI